MVIGVNLERLTHAVEDDSVDDPVEVLQDVDDLVVVHVDAYDADPHHELVHEDGEEGEEVDYGHHQQHLAQLQVLQKRRQRVALCKTNKTGTSKVGAISTVQKAQKTFF